RSVLELVDGHRALEHPVADLPVPRVPRAGLLQGRGEFAAPTRDRVGEQRLTLDSGVVAVDRAEGERDVLAPALEAADPRSLGVDQRCRDHAAVEEHEALVERGLTVGTLGECQRTEATARREQRARPRVAPEAARVAGTLAVDA